MSAAATPVTLPATLTLEQASATLAELLPRLRSAAAPLLDASALVELDTSAVAVLLECGRAVHAAGRKLSVTGAPDKLVQLAQLYGVDSLLAFQAGGAASLASAASTGTAGTV